MHKNHFRSETRWDSKDIIFLLNLYYYKTVILKYLSIIIICNAIGYNGYLFFPKTLHNYYHILSCIIVISTCDSILR